jgi:hypothetical protein
VEKYINSKTLEPFLENFSRAPPANQLAFAVVQLHFPAQAEAKQRQVEPVKNFGKGSRVLQLAGKNK